ncbi:hypothetical protein C9374_003376 [Naegleria lovaniensis]|uniref:Uncharacterized protein n=1 Tax=Naegleria lovaniensis TaxID=51637 RepID=A0AA88GNU5_NAELO|nr:uncharacterized protein C9374_003376 [Naegleria lovaniensis]KAG2385561.1 hypothetical protein C9374_003376 [Naegleria lovaniensis]
MKQSESVLLEVEKRKHCKNPFDDRFLKLVLSSFHSHDTLENTEKDMEESIYNASVHVSLRTELIKEMLKQTANEVDKLVIQTVESRRDHLSEGSSGTAVISRERFPKYDRSRYLAYSSQNEKSIKEFSEIAITDEYTSKNTCLKELPYFTPTYSNQFYVLSELAYYNDHKESINHLVEAECLDSVFTGFESVLTMNEEKIEHLFRQEGIETTIYEDVVPPEDDVWVTSYPTEACNDENVLLETTWEKEEATNESTLSSQDSSRHQKVSFIQKDFTYTRVFNLDAAVEPPRVKGKDMKLRLKQSYEDNLLIPFFNRQQPFPLTESSLTSWQDMMHKEISDLNFGASLISPEIDIVKISSCMGNTFCDFLFNNDICYEHPSVDAREGTDEYLFGETPQTQSETKTIIERILESLHQRKNQIPMVKISSLIQEQLRTTTTATLTELRKKTGLCNIVSKPRFFMALLHFVHHNNSKTESISFELSNFSKGLGEIRVVKSQN